jgi:hypothetical protein
MAEIIGLNIKINKDRFKKIYLQNSGQKITTKGIKKGWNALKSELDSSFIEDLKKSPYYLKVEDEQNS